MELNELPAIVDELEYPIAAAAVTDAIGDRTVDAPNATDSEELGTILDRAGETTYESSDALLTAVRGNLSDEYVGRKYYDDRGSNPRDDEDDRGSAESF